MKGTEDQLRGLFRQAEAAMDQAQLEESDIVRRARRRRSRAASVVAIGTAVMLAAALGAASILVRSDVMAPASPGQIDELSKRTFFSVRVVEDGVPRELVPGTRIRFGFMSDDDMVHGEGSEEWTSGGNGAIGWQAGCNRFSMRVELGDERIRDVGGGVSSTQMLCEGESGEQDRWLGMFLASDPTWKVEDDRLTLASGGTIIELAEERLPLTLEEFRERWDAWAPEMGLTGETGFPEDDVDLFPPTLVYSDLRMRGDLVHLMREGRVNGDGSMIDLELWSSYLYEPVTAASWRVLIRAVNPDFGWNEVDALIAELGGGGLDDDDPHGFPGRESSVEVVRGEVRYTLVIRDNQSTLTVEPASREGQA